MAGLAEVGEHQVNSLYDVKTSIHELRQEAVVHTELLRQIRDALRRPGA